MALERNYKLDWNDIALLFSALNTERQEFQYSALSYPNPNSKKRTKTSESIEALVDGIEEMLSNSYIQAQASSLTVSDIIIPQPKDRMKPDIFDQINNKIGTIQGVCFGFNGSGFNASDFGHSTCFDDGCFSHSGFGFWYSGSGCDGDSSCPSFGAGMSSDSGCSHGSNSPVFW